MKGETWIMHNMNMICVWIAEVVPLIATLVSLVYGLVHFFRKGRPLFLQSLTMGMACYALGNIYHLCMTSTSEVLLEGFTPAYLGRIGFFMFLITGSYGQLDRIVDDRSDKMRRARLIALLAPLCAIVLYIPNYTINNSPMSTKITYALVWIPAIISVYFNLKHAIIPDFDFGFIKALRCYNILALCLVFSELICLTAWDYFKSEILAVMSIAFSIFCICTMIAAKKGVEKWTI
jgi:hypothetical protein